MPFYDQQKNILPLFSSTPGYAGVVFCLPETHFHKVSGHILFVFFRCLHRRIPLMRTQMH